MCVGQYVALNVDVDTHPIFVRQVGPSVSHRSAKLGEAWIRFTVAYKYLYASAVRPEVIK